MVRRQILEGVLAIVRLDTTGLTKGKVSVQIFDRRAGANNVQFNGKYTRFVILKNTLTRSQNMPTWTQQQPAFW